MQMLRPYEIMHNNIIKMVLYHFSKLIVHYEVVEARCNVPHVYQLKRFILYHVWD
jgi:hypothetical protein